MSQTKKKSPTSTHTHKINHKSIKNFDTYINTFVDTINEDNIEDENQYNYIFDDDEKTKNKQKINKLQKLEKIKKDYTSVLNYNYLWLKEERKAAFKIGKGYGAATIKEEVDSCISLLSVIPKIFIDIGAHVGEYTKEVLKRYPKIDIYLFEPSSENKPILDNSFSKLSNVNTNSCALSNKNGKHKLYFDKAGSVLASLTNRRLEHFDSMENMNNSEEIDVKRFDDFWKTTKYKNNTIIDYVKIDVEGHELNVLEGFGDLIYNIRIIQFEFGGANIDTRTFFQDFWYFFKDKNFMIYRISPIGVIPVKNYSESDEFFSTTNYIAVNDKFNTIEIVDNYNTIKDKKKNKVKDKINYKLKSKQKYKGKPQKKTHKNKK